MIINVGIADALYRQIKSAVTCKEVQHVVKESAARCDVSLAASVKINIQLYICLVCFSVDISCSHLKHPFVFSIPFLRIISSSIAMQFLKLMF